MSYINNMNPRRMIWFNQNAPKNKMDLWLSYNRHYEDTSEDETVDPQLVDDNPNQRKCDLILKAWDCGKWVPIVGFNTTAANKIDTVTGVDYTIDGVTHSGKNVYHPAIFTDKTPNELYDAGSLGSLLSNSNFVTSQEWQNIFNSQNFQNAWSAVINNIPIRRATASVLGGVWADTFATVAANGFAQCKFKGSSDSNLYVSGSDVIGAINAYYTSGGTTPIDIQLANTTDIGGIKADVQGSGTTALRLVEVKLFPIGNAKFERLSVDSNEIIDDIIGTFNDEYPLLLGGNGITLGQTLDHSQITWEVSNLKYAEDGKYARSKVIGGNHTIEWVDLPEGTEYTAGVGINIPTGTTVINANILEKESSPHQSGETLIRIVDNPSGQVFVHNVTSSSMGITTLNSYEYTEVETDASKFVVALKNKNINPIYIKLNHQSPMSVEASGGTIEYVLTGWDFVASGIPSGNTLITVQFGAVKIEPIKTLS